MKCTSCNEKKGSTRCEGCNVLLCLPCMNIHHEELIQHFQLLTNIRNELKASLETASIIEHGESKLPCLIKIDRWEQWTIERVRETARKVRTNIKEIMTKNISDVHYQLEQVSIIIQQQEKEGSYLESDMKEVANQLNELSDTVQQMKDTVQVITFDNIDWDALIHVRTDERLIKDSNELSTNLTHYDIRQNRYPSSIEENLPVKSSRRCHRGTQSNTRPATPLFSRSHDPNYFHPISSSTCIDDDSSDSDDNAKVT